MCARGCARILANVRMSCVIWSWGCLSRGEGRERRRGRREKEEQSFGDEEIDEGKCLIRGGCEKVNGIAEANEGR